MEGFGYTGWTYDIQYIFDSDRTNLASYPCEITAVIRSQTIAFEDQNSNYCMMWSIFGQSSKDILGRYKEPNIDDDINLYDKWLKKRKMINALYGLDESFEVVDGKCKNFTADPKEVCSMY